MDKETIITILDEILSEALQPVPDAPDSTYKQAFENGFREMTLKGIVYKIRLLKELL